MGFSRANTDDLCFDKEKKGGKLRKGVYWYNLWTGLYMLDPREKLVINVVITILVAMSCLYTVAFWKGVVEGWNEVAQERQINGDHHSVHVDDSYIKQISLLEDLEKEHIYEHNLPRFMFPKMM